jgi:hypothetical protein
LEGAPPPATMLLLLPALNEMRRKTSLFGGDSPRRRTVVSIDGNLQIIYKSSGMTYI